MDKDVIKYCIQYMSTIGYTQNLFDIYKIEYRKSDSLTKLAERYYKSENITFSLKDLRIYFRNKWKPSPKGLHISNLKSNQLVGHSWHGAMPSMLHLSMQKKVRDHIDGKLSLEDLITVGSDIIKHEYFMVCVHDLCETMIIQEFPKTIPPIGKKSISDFVFNDVPYDLKITNYFPGQTKQTVNANKIDIVYQLLAGADILRLREQAKKTLNNWGLNRFYVLVEDQDRWIKKPETLLEELKNEVKKIGPPIKVIIDDITILAQLIAI
jgi:hypothetical protein